MDEKSGTLHFSVDGAFLMDLARQGYWFENRQEWARSLLRTLKGPDGDMSEQQIMALLNGDAVLTGVAAFGGDTDIKFWLREDTEFKAKLEERKKFLASKYVVLAGFLIPKDHLEDYVTHTVKRLREAIQHPGLYRDQPLLLYDLEMERRRLHDQLFADAGFDRVKDKPGVFKKFMHDPKRDEAYDMFDTALNKYVDEEAPFESRAYTEA